MLKTHVAVSDVTPNRCTVQAIGDYDHCVMVIERDGDGTWQVLATHYIGEDLQVGDRAHHGNSGEVWK